MERICLDKFFPNRWIRRRDSMEWSFRSPDSTLLDFLLRDYLKSKLFKNITYKICLKDKTSLEFTRYIVFENIKQ